VPATVELSQQTVVCVCVEGMIRHEQVLKRGLPACDAQMCTAQLRTPPGHETEAAVRDFPEHLLLSPYREKTLLGNVTSYRHQREPQTTECRRKSVQPHKTEVQ
jgi:hypothetical protein